MAIDQAVLRPIKTCLVDAFDRCLAARAGRQWRTRAVQIVERTGRKHVGFANRAQQACQGQRRQFGIATHDQQVLAGHPRRKDRRQRLRIRRVDIGVSSRVRVARQRNACADEDEVGSGNLGQGSSQPRFAAGPVTVHAETDEVRRQVLHDLPGRSGSRIIGDGGAHCHGCDGELRKHPVCANWAALP